MSARVGLVDRKLEQWFQGMLESVPEGGRTELALSARGGEEEVGSAKLKLAVEHQDGEVLVTVQGAAALGVGGLAKGAEAVTFRFGSDQEAADALAQVLSRFIRDQDSLARVFHAEGRLQSLDIAVSGDIRWTPDDVKLDLAKGELMVSTSFGAGLNESVSEKMLSEILAGSNPMSDVRGSASLEQRFPLSLQDLEQIQKRGLAALKEIATDRARCSRTEAVFRLEGNVGGLDFEAEHRGNPTEILEAVENVDVLKRKDWSFQGFKVSGEVSTGFDAGPLKLEATVKDRQTVITGRGELAPLVQQGTSRAEEAKRRALGS